MFRKLNQLKRLRLHAIGRETAQLAWKQATQTE